MIVEPTAYRHAMACLPTGVTVLTTVAGGRAEAMTANAVMSVSLNPVLLAVSIKAPSRWLSAVTEHGAFAVNVLAEHHEPLARWAASPARHSATDPLGGWATVTSEQTRCALVEDAVALFDCTVDAIHGAGDHSLVIGRVIGVCSSELARPLVFHASGYTGLPETAAALRSAAG